MSSEPSTPHNHHNETPPAPEDAWRNSGVQVIPADSLDTNTAQTPGMNRAAAINIARVGARKLWAGTVAIHGDAKTGAHHHECAGATTWSSWPKRGQGNFIYVPPYVPHQEINPLKDEDLECDLVRSDGEAIAVNLPDVEPVEKPETRYISSAHVPLA
ncbi:hypothetical protein DL769_001710 [Monosporascus sp. CRB-8-3]|nr:hypothetical protein DL769_001710 [Monosporascus sp. CRB-8-3]